MNRLLIFAVVLFSSALVVTSCKKNRPSEKIAGTYSGHFQGTFEGNDTIVNEGYKVTITATDKNNATVSGSMFGDFDVLVTNNGLNVELVSPTEGLNQFLYEGESRTLTFTYVTDAQNTATYVGTK